MKSKVLIGFVFLLIGFQAKATSISQNPDSIISWFGEPDSLDSVPVFNSPVDSSNIVVPVVDKEEIVTQNQHIIIDAQEILARVEPVKIDSFLLSGNPLLIELVFQRLPDPKLSYEFDMQTLFYGSKPKCLIDTTSVPMLKISVENIITELRTNARNDITRHAAHLYTVTYDKLPDLNGFKSFFIENTRLTGIKLVDDNQSFREPRRKLIVKQVYAGPWKLKANTLLQFSQNMSSSNWHQGGSSTMSVLGVLTGQLNYDNKKNIQWENYAEWRMGFYAVFNDTTAMRDINVNDDLLKINSKLGIKAGDNFFYSGSVDFSTQFIQNYKSVSSNVLKASFLTPIRLNVGVGLDYKYKKLLSVMLSPIAFKYIYANDSNVSVNLFGIKTGEKHLSQIGSSFKVQLSFSPIRVLQVDSRLNFYTNYEKVEVDWEIIGNFTINRFLSTRLLFNPRFDNTVIGEKAKIQYKELLSFGFSYKLLN